MTRPFASQTSSEIDSKKRQIVRAYSATGDRVKLATEYGGPPVKATKSLNRDPTEAMRNIEAKFPLPDIAAAQQRAEAVGFVYVGTLVQHDTFFVASNGKLKLREQPDGAWLIHYQRDHANGLELSNYEIVGVAEPAKLRALLSAALGVFGEIHKRRVLLRRANIRLHLDELADFGLFGELEAVMDAGEDPADSRAQIALILTALQIPSEQLIGVSYIELPR